jgi:hypothetical protein
MLNSNTSAVSGDGLVAMCRRNHRQLGSIGSDPWYPDVGLSVNFCELTVQTAAMQAFLLTVSVHGCLANAALESAKRNAQLRHPTDALATAAGCNVHNADGLVTAQRNLCRPV